MRNAIITFCALVVLVQVGWREFLLFLAALLVAYALGGIGAGIYSAWVIIRRRS